MPNIRIRDEYVPTIRNEEVLVASSGGLYDENGFYDEEDTYDGIMGYSTTTPHINIKNEFIPNARIISY